MEVIVNAILFESPDNIKIFSISGKESNCNIIKLKLKQEHEKLVDYLKILLERKVIKSLFRPKNKSIQKQLNQVVKAKREIKKSLEKIMVIFR